MIEFKSTCRENKQKKKHFHIPYAISYQVEADKRYIVVLKEINNED